MPSLITTRFRVGALRIASLRALFVAASLLCASAEVFAAGLGRMEVLTALGTPLRAEIVVIADKNEIPSLSGKIATPAAFQNAGLVYSPVIADMRVAIQKRANGEPYISVTTTTPLNEPVVDLLVELTWSSGRVIREYTAFIDPPFLIAEREKQRAAEAAKPTTSAAPPEAAPKPEPLPEAPAPTAEAPIPTTPTDTTATASPEPTEPTAPAQPQPAPQEPSQPVETIGGTAPTLLLADDRSSLPMAAGADTYGPTKSGDTLSKIALASKPADVTLEQMLVVLFRNNPDAFSGKNMNRLKTGKIIRLPDASEYGTVSARAARTEVRLQSANWNAYRERLAAAAAQEAPAEPAAQQAASGQVVPKVEDKTTPATQPKDVVKLSKGEPGAAASAGGPERTKAVEEELVARDKALKEANERVAKLEKTVKDLQALVEVKNQGMADLQRQAAAGATPATPTAPAGAAKPAQQVAPGATQPAPATSAAQTPAPARPTAPTAAGPSAQPAPTPGQAVPKPEQPATPPASPATQAAPPPTPAPAQQPRRRPAPPPPEPSLLDNVLSQPLYLVAGVLIVGLIGLLAVRTVRRRRETKSKTEEVAPATVAFAASGAGRSLGPTESDVGLATRSREIAEEVDPLEEAEIFLAYGRDSQAEDLLKEAISANPRRYEIHAKLLEIYARRKDVKSFEQVARDVQQGTGGQGEVWERIVSLGYQIDPQNARYSAGRGGVHAEESKEPSAAERLDLDVGLGDETETSATTDIDLGDTVKFDRTQIMSTTRLAADEGSEPAASGVDLNIDLPAVEPGGGSEPAAPSSNAINFDFDIGKLSAGEPRSTAATSAPATSAVDSGLDFDVGSLSLESGETAPMPSAASPSIDLSTISLDLGGATTSPTAAALGKDEKWYEVQTKFDLAKAYQEMGDRDGAREILNEVIAEGDAEQKAAAQAVLASLE